VGPRGGLVAPAACGVRSLAGAGAGLRVQFRVAPRCARTKARNGAGASWDVGRGARADAGRSGSTACWWGWLWRRRATGAGLLIKVGRLGSTVRESVWPGRVCAQLQRDFARAFRLVYRWPICVADRCPPPTMSAVAVGVLLAVVSTLVVFLARSLHKYDDTLYSRLPHDKDLQVCAKKCIADGRQLSACSLARRLSHSSCQDLSRRACKQLL